MATTAVRSATGVSSANQKAPRSVTTPTVQRFTWKAQLELHIDPLRILILWRSERKSCSRAAERGFEDGGLPVLHFRDVQGLSVFPSKSLHGQRSETSDASSRLNESIDAANPPVNHRPTGHRYLKERFLQLSPSDMENWNLFFNVFF